jgi:PhnO protein
MEMRKATAQDIKAVYRLLCELEHMILPFDAFHEVYNGNLYDPLIHYYVCEIESCVIAFASLHIQPLLHHCAHIAEIQEIIVQSEHQGNGIGQLLFQRLEAIAREAGCEWMEVCCNQKNTPALRFYESRGMKNTHNKLTFPLL